MSQDDPGTASFLTDVLIIEDDPTQAEELACYLRRAGLRVDATVSGSLAIHTVARLRPKVALIDYNLPDLDGVTVAERIKRLSPGTAMIVMSGRIDGLSDHTLANTGIFTFMNKPVALGPLRSAVLTLIRTTTRTGLPPPLPKKRLLPLPFGSFSLSRSSA
ncbi:response regulator [Reyranella sp.]|jgi:DNA-binding response OmpR family regulator|uniref:response regulator n=1 Tax=Reyranella sp. TaxID=1929291 RepID=UPI001200EB68|nr:response regulator [Reyranella sp.]TAJ82475.1 MAG: response regulator [Reyranella sp.]